MPTHYYFDAMFSFHSREIYPSESVGADEVLVSAENPTVENFLGFGVAITGASCYLLNKMEKSERNAFLRGYETYRSLYHKSFQDLSPHHLQSGQKLYAPISQEDRTGGMLYD